MFISSRGNLFDLHMTSGEVVITGSILTGERMVSLSCIMTSIPFGKC